jgi:hypothetical protein
VSVVTPFKPENAFNPRVAKPEPRGVLSDVSRLKSPGPSIVSDGVIEAFVDAFHRLERLRLDELANFNVTFICSRVPSDVLKLGSEKVLGSDEDVSGSLIVNLSIFSGDAVAPVISRRLAAQLQARTNIE